MTAEPDFRPIIPVCRRGPRDVKVRGDGNGLRKRYRKVRTSPKAATDFARRRPSVTGRGLGVKCSGDLAFGLWFLDELDGFLSSYGSAFEFVPITIGAPFIQSTSLPRDRNRQLQHRVANPAKLSPSDWRACQMASASRSCAKSCACSTGSSRASGMSDKGVVQIGNPQRGSFL